MPRKPSPPPSKSADQFSQHLCRHLKKLRTQRGWSLETLARSSGVSRSMLSQIERARANPTVAVTFRIARAFGMSLGELVEAPDTQPAIKVIRSNDQAYHYRSEPDYRIRTLSPLNLEKDVEFYEVVLKPGGALRSSPHFEGTREFVVLQKGQLRVESAKESEHLDPGDSASYRADRPHGLINTGKTDATIFLVVIYQ